MRNKTSNICRYIPQQNSVAERMNRTLVEMTRRLILEANLPENTPAYIRHRCPTSLNKKCTPIDIWTGKEPVIKHLRQIGRNRMF